MKTITIAVKEPGKVWHITEVEDALPTYQNIVGGYIEGFRSIGPITMFCNEEGKLQGLEPNIYVPQLNDVICGTIFAAKTDDEGEFVSLTEEDISSLFFTIEMD